MRHIFLLLLLTISNLAASSQVNWISDANPNIETLPSTPHNLFKWKGHIYFNALQEETNSLWRTDGTVSGTVLIKSNIQVYQFAATDSLLFFSANEPLTGTELWVSDGTAPGTHIVKDIVTGPESSNPAYLDAIEGKVVFVNKDTNGQSRIWVSNGSTNGTIQLSDIPDKHSIYKTIAHREKAYLFSRNDDFSWSIFRTDGTESGTEKFFTFASNSGGKFIPESITFIDQALYFFTKKDSVWGLWKTDGTASGTQFLVSLPRITHSFLQIAPQVTKWKGEILLLAGSPGSLRGTALWKTQGIQWDLELIYDFKEDAVIYLSPGEHKLFLSGKQSQWVSDGTRTGTHLLYRHFLPAPEPFPWIVYKKTAFVTHRDSILVSDGTRAGTYRLGNVLKKATNLHIYFMNPEFCIINGKAVFPAQGSDESTDIELWTSDGTESGTQKITDINSIPLSDGQQEIYLTKNRMFFRAKDSLGNELWTSDGTTQGTYLIKDIQQGPKGSNPHAFTEMNDKVYFSAKAEYSGTHIAWHNRLANLWETDGTTEGTKKVSNSYLPSKPNRRYPLDKAVFNNKLYFQGATETDRGFDLELWTSDGTNSGTRLLKNINPLSSRTYYTSSNPGNFVQQNGKLYFKAEHVVYGREWWMSDGTEAGTHILIDLVLGERDGTLGGLDFLKVGAGVFFPGKANLWLTDGTEIGTTTFPESDYFQGGKNPVLFGVFNDEVLFQKTDERNELFITDIQNRKVQKLANIEISRDNGRISTCGDCHSALDSVFLFAAKDSLNGWELWRTNGRPEGTWLLKEINPGKASSFPRSFVRYLDLIYFIATAPDGRSYIYRTNGNAQTEIAALSREGDPGYNPRFLFLWNNQLYFIGDHPDYGESFYSLSPGEFVEKEYLNTTSKPVYVHLYPNPARSGSNIEVAFRHAYIGKAELSLYDIQGKLIRNYPFDKQQIYHRENFSAPDVPKGIYLVVVKLGNISLFKKLMINK